MISQKEAQQLVLSYLAGAPQPANDSYAIVEHETIEKPWGWVFFYSSKKFLTTGDLNYASASYPPLFVSNKGGKVLVGGMDEEVHYYIRKYESTGDPSRDK